MRRKNSSQTPRSSKTDEQLTSTGLALEHFPEFTQKTHNFHTHDFVEILFVLKGNIRHVIADQTYDESAGGLTLLNHNQFHTLTTPASAAELMNLYWNPAKYPAPELPMPLSSRLNELIPALPQLGHRLNRVFHLQMKNPDKTAQLLRMLHAEQQESQPAHETAIDALFRIFLIELCRAAPSIGHTPAANPRMETVRLYLEKHYYDAIRLEQLCEISKLKKANLCRQFKAYTGLSTGDYLKQRRLAAAMRQLRTTSEKVLTICYDSGFSDIAHFNRTFRAAIGQTPSEYRKNN